MAKFLMCDGPGCTTQAAFHDSKGWRWLQTQEVSADSGEPEGIEDEALLCPVCVAKVTALVWPKMAPLPVVANASMRD